MKVKISNIKINPGRRETEPKAIEELARSIVAVGLMNPITLDQNNTLIAGLHRLEAAKLMGWTEIECNIIGMSGLQAELAEIDENIVRTKLTKQELGDQLLRRKAPPGNESWGGAGGGNESRYRQQRRCQIGTHDKILC